MVGEIDYGNVAAILNIALDCCHTLFYFVWSCSRCHWCKIQLMVRYKFNIILSHYSCVDYIVDRLYYLYARCQG